MRISRLQSRLPVLAAAVAALALSAPQPASADAGEKIIYLCEHIKPISGFSHAAYEQALKEIAAGTEEYSECGQQIAQAELAAARGKGHNGGGGTGGGSAGSVASTAVAASPAEQRAITHAASSAPGPLELGGGGPIQPGVVHSNISSALSGLPTPIVATLAFLLACALLAAGGFARNRVRTRRGA